MWFTALISVLCILMHFVLFRVLRHSGGNFINLHLFVILFILGVSTPGCITNCVIFVLYLSVLVLPNFIVTFILVLLRLC